jgi:6-pyruvoyl tetrahydropterin synthase/QueD family protein
MLARARPRGIVHTMYTLGVRDHFHVAHRLDGDVFGPAQRMHGVTYTVSVEVDHEELDEHGIVCDANMLRARLRQVLDELDYKNLDDHPAFDPGKSTSEHIARFIHRELGRTLPLATGTLLTVSLEQSPVIWVKYRAAVRGGSMVPREELGQA